MHVLQTQACVRVRVRGLSADACALSRVPQVATAADVAAVGARLDRVEALLKELVEKVDRQ